MGRIPTQRENKWAIGIRPKRKAKRFRPSPNLVWGSRHWRGEGQAKSAVARSAPTGVLAIGRGSGRRGSALTRADDDGFDRGGKYEL